VYDGKFSCKDYLVQFETIAQLKDWDEITQAMELANCLNGTVRRVLTIIDSPQWSRLSAACKGFVKTF